MSHPERRFCEEMIMPRELIARANPGWMQRRASQTLPAGPSVGGISCSRRNGRSLIQRVRDDFFQGELEWRLRGLWSKGLSRSRVEFHCRELAPPALVKKTKHIRPVAESGS